ncbi:hypothetical protein BRC82_04040 [Halobacteriales archaeon QS_1_67_19]|nr:MAG: hypothetical protein BRC82_04040 [Halobacteriales archaeon QS_1_67_19]
MTNRDVELGSVLRAFVRVAYTESLTVATTSLLFVLGSLPLITAGSAFVAIVEVWTETVLAESEGRRLRERERAGRFVEAWLANLRAGVPYSAVLLVAMTGLVAYRRLSVVTGDALFFLWTLVGLYAVVVVAVWLLRAASIRVRAAGDPPRFIAAMRRAGYSLLEEPSFTVLTIVGAGIVCLLGLVSPPVFVVVGPGLLAAGEVVGFEELFGDSAAAIRAAYAA